MGVGEFIMGKFMSPEEKHRLGVLALRCNPLWLDMLAEVSKSLSYPGASSYVREAVTEKMVRDGWEPPEAAPRGRRKGQG